MSNKSTTTNGMATNKSSKSKCLDLFFLIAASRGKNIINEFNAAYKENMDLAVRILLWSRDVREGAGERSTFRTILKTLIHTQQEVAVRILSKIPELGRWDDVLEYIGTPLEAQAVELISFALADGNPLCAKWLPRPAGKHAAIANVIRKGLGMSPKDFRKLLVDLSDTVEQKMCAQKWNEIDFSKIPSLASARYQKAFGRAAPEAYTKYIDSLVKGETKINAGAVYPHDIINSIERGNAAVAGEQWKALPNYLEGSTKTLLPVIDVSGSMSAKIGGSNTISCMDVAIALGMYIAERNEGEFQDAFITFHERPQLIKMPKGSLLERYRKVKNANWGYNTNLEAVFDLVITSAVTHKVPKKNMPSTILILSDMEFDQACKKNSTALKMIKKKFTDNGYKVPEIVFWNLNGRVGNVPAKSTDKGTALVSGFSPSIMKSLLNGDIQNPQAVMTQTVNIARYDF